MEALLGMNQGNFLFHVLDYVSCKCLLILSLIFSRNFSLWVATGEIGQTKTEVAIPWWRHQIETFSALLALCAGNSPVPGEFPAQRPVTRSFDIFFDLRLNKRLSKQPWGWWFETPSWSLWRQWMLLDRPTLDICIYVDKCLLHYGRVQMESNVGEHK